MLDRLTDTGPESEHIVIVTGLEGPVVISEPVTCSYCDLGIVESDDHAANCYWRPGKVAAR